MQRVGCAMGEFAVGRDERPLVPGFYPDPSICRVGNDYFLAMSSFEYFPGVPVFRSEDLLEWNQIGNALERPSQLKVRSDLDGASMGIYAPTIRHHDGRFWLITTNVDLYDQGQLIVTADDPGGPWSDPKFVSGAIGIDPDLVWDDGVCHIAWKDKVNGGISGAIIDPDRAMLLSRPTTLWRGSGLAHTEGPHRFRRGGYWYLVVAEGGTHTGHGVSIARSRRIDGPYEPFSANPFFSHRSTTSPVQAVGHADLVECPDGSWAMVYLGIRARGQFPGFHVNGRETFATRIDWEGDWPVVAGAVQARRTPSTSFFDDFVDPRLNPRWISPGVDPNGFAHTGSGGLALSLGRGPEETRSRGLLGVRARDERWTASAEVVRGNIALTVRMDDAHWFGIELIDGRARVRACIGQLSTVLGEADAVGVTGIVIRAVSEDQTDHRSGPDRLEAGIAGAKGETILGTMDGRYVSTEVAGGFTGRVIGVEALGGPARIRSFSYVADAPT